MGLFSLIAQTKIHRLSDETINQIAAGEVVENPASVVKEIVENAVDADAKKIIIEIKGGGHLLIRVSDDGSGMGKEDALLSLERHTTSKIIHAQELSHLVSMGFRGEALASIAAVSKVRLETSLSGETATEIVCHGGKILSIQPASRVKGTTIEIASLFYNTPARKKFQKAASRSSIEIAKIVTKLALAHREVSFTLISQGESVLITTNDRKNRISEVLGPSFVKDTRNVSYTENDHTYEGVIGSPQTTRTNRSGQYLFINNRPIHSPLVADAVKEAFGTRIATHDFPVFVLWITMPTDRVDVNVHPQKETVRFEQEELIHQYTVQAIQKALAGVPTFPLQMEAPRFVTKPFALAEAPVTYRRQEPQKESSFFISSEIAPRFSVWGFIEGYAIVEQLEGVTPFGEGRAVVVVDLPKVESRITFDAILKRLEKQTKPPAQSLLFPETIEVGPAAAEILLANLELFQTIGFVLKPRGKGIFSLEGIAPIYSLATAKEVIDQLLDEMKGKISFEKIARIAAIPLKKIYSKMETERLVQELLQATDPHFAPGGEKLFFPLDKAQMERYAKN